LSLLGRVGRSVTSTVVGHAITLRELFRKPITVMYPEERREQPLGSRNIPVLKVNEQSGLINCTSCGLCERNCPPSVIHIQQAVDPETGKKKPWPERWKLEYDHCMVCNICVEVCPFDALEMADVNELSSYRIEDLTFEKDDLIELWKTSNALRVHDGMAMPTLHPQAGSSRHGPGAEAQGDGPAGADGAAAKPAGVGRG
jgi:NADH-quinone oxidoreductase subunit I